MIQEVDAFQASQADGRAKGRDTIKARKEAIQKIWGQRLDELKVEWDSQDRHLTPSRAGALVWAWWVDNHIMFPDLPGHKRAYEIEGVVYFAEVWAQTSTVWNKKP